MILVTESEKYSLPERLPDLPIDWEYISLGNLTKTSPICYGVVQPGKDVERGVPIIRVNNIRNGQLDTTDMKLIDPSISENYKRSEIVGGEVLLTLVGTLGEVAIAPPEASGWNVARAVGVIRVNADIENRWVAICLQSPFVQRYIEMWATRTVQATFNLRDAVRLPIPIPPKKERQQIGELLYALDDKIELNRRMNETLEAIARAIFKSWFVDFDPVRAKLEGQSHEQQSSASAYPMPAEVYDLFPSAFQDSELGKIPEGWDVRPLEEL